MIGTAIAGQLVEGRCPAARKHFGVLRATRFTEEMEEAQPLARPAEIYEPFTAEEREVLSTFVGNVRSLGKMRFFDQVPKSASITYDATGTRAEMVDPEDEAVRAAITLFRQIYTETEPASAAAALKILKRQIRGRPGPSQADALQAIKELRSWLNEILERGIGLGIVFERPTGSDPITPRKILDAYFHGHYLHSGNKTKLARELDQLEPWARYTFYSVMWKLTRAYWVIANVAELALRTPAAIAPD